MLLFQLFPYFYGFSERKSRGFAGLKEKNDVAAAEEEGANLFADAKK